MDEALLISSMQQFALKLCRQNLAGMLGFVGIMASFTATGLLASLAPAGDGQFVLWVVLGGAGCYGVYRLVRRVAVREAQVLVEPAQLTVTYPATGQQVQVPFAEVISYRDELLRDGRELRFRLRTGKKIKLVTNNFLGAAGDYEGLLQALETALAAYQSTVAYPAAATITREKSFYEKPWATLLLVVAGLPMLVTFGDALLRGKPLPGTAITSLGLFISYAGLWYTARQRRAK